MFRSRLSTPPTVLTLLIAALTGQAQTGSRSRLDAPLTTGLDQAYGGWIARYEFPGRIEEVGMENLRLVSAYEYPQLRQAIEQAEPGAVRAETRPAALVRNHPESNWCMAHPGHTYLIYPMAGEPAELDLGADRAEYGVTWMGVEGALKLPAARIRGGGKVELNPPTAGQPWLAWLSRSNDR